MKRAHKICKFTDRTFLELILDNLKQYIEHFYGYGNLNSSSWFIGLEEGGEGTVDDLLKRVSIWNSYRTTTVCLKEFHEKLGIDSHFREAPKLQPYWAKIIKILLTIEGKDSTEENTRNYQREYLGRLNSNHALLELGAIPCKNIKNWGYSNIEYEILASKEKYLNFVLNNRNKTLKSLIEKHKPKNIFFMGKSADYVAQWLNIHETEYQEIENFLFSQDAGTNFYICNHPNSHGITNDYFIKIGQHCKEHSGTW